MSEQQQEAQKAVERIEVDLTNVPLRPLSRKEVQQLEMALIVGTLYRPEVLELIRDPLEKSTWVDSLAVAAAALAREKAGYTVNQIAEELGRSSTTIRAHLQGKTKAGKLVRETYELLARGKLRIFVPFTSAPSAEKPSKSVEELEEKLRILEEENRRLREQLEKCIKPEELEEKLKKLREELTKLEEENRELRRKVEELERYRRLVDQIKTVMQGLGGST